MLRAAEGEDELVVWLRDGYATAYRTAYGLLGNRGDAEDAVQEAFLRAWRFRAAVPGGAVGPWMYRVVVNASLSKLRADGRRRTVAPPAGSDPPDAADLATDGDPLGAALVSEARSAVLDALADLPEHLRVVVVLRYYAGLSEREIAQVIHRRPGTVKSRLHAARTRLGADERLGRLASSEVGADAAATGTDTGGR